MQQFDFFLAETQINRFLAPCRTETIKKLRKDREKGEKKDGDK